MAGSSSSKKEQFVAYRRQFFRLAVEADLMDLLPEHAMHVSEKCIWLVEHDIVDMVDYKESLLCEGADLEVPDIAFTRHEVLLDLPDFSLEVGRSFFQSNFEPRIITDGWRRAFVHGVTPRGDLLMFAPFVRVDIAPQDMARKYAEESLTIAHILDIAGGTRLHILVCGISEAIMLPYDVDEEEKIEARELAEALLLAWSSKDG